MDINRAIQVMQAAASGKRIQFLALTSPHATWVDAPTPNWNWADCDYRIAPELNPFHTVVRFLIELDRHSVGYHLVREDGDVYVVVNVNMEDNTVKIRPRDSYYGDDEESWINLYSLSMHYRFGDGTPCGYTPQD